MDEWVQDGKAVEETHPLSFKKADMELCFNRIRGVASTPGKPAFPAGDVAGYSASFDAMRCLIMQGGQGDVKHWAFNDPPSGKAHGRTHRHTCGIRQTGHAHGGPASHDHYAERTHVRWRPSI